jgi:hypothetical protein
MVLRYVETELQRKAAVTHIDALKLPFTVEVVKSNPRSLAQNRLQHTWVREIAQQWGDGQYTTEEVRGYCKLHFGIPILRNDSEAYRATYDKWVRPLSYEAKLAYMQVPFDFEVSRLFKTDQMTRYLDAIWRFAGEQGFVLTNPDDNLYEEMVGTRKDEEAEHRPAN